MVTLIRTLNIMETFKHPHCASSFVFSIALLLAVAVTACVAVALVRNTTWSGEHSAAFARPLQVPESSPRDRLSQSSTVGPVARKEGSSSDGERISQPRECDLAKGITTECIFMD